MRTEALILFVLTAFCHSSFAGEFMAQGRIFGGNTTAAPTELNNEMTAQGLKTYGTLGKIGAEITYTAFKSVEVGFSYTKRGVLVEENPENPATAYDANLSQDIFMGVARVPFLKNKNFRMDIFAGVGGANTKLTVRTATQNGELSNGSSATVVYSYGASIGFGINGIYLYAEGGFDNNLVKDLTRTGTINNNVQEMNLSGPYISLGLLFDGVKAHN